MNQLRKSLFTYKDSISSIETAHRDNEYAAMSKITYTLQKSYRSKNENINDFLIALNNNLKLWAIFAVDVSRKENLLPNGLKSVIFYLFEFTQLETHKIIRGEGDPQALIDINKTIMKGLRGAEVEKCQD